MVIRSQAPLKEPVHPMMVNPYHEPTLLNGLSADFYTMLVKLENFWSQQEIQWQMGIEREFRFGNVEEDNDSSLESASQSGAKAQRTYSELLDQANDKLTAYVKSLRQQQRELSLLTPDECHDRILQMRSEHGIAFGALNIFGRPTSKDLTSGAAVFDVLKSDSAEQMVRDEAAIVTRIYRNRLRLRDELRKHFDAAVEDIKKNKPDDAEAIRQATLRRNALERFDLRAMIMCWMYELSPIKDHLEYVFDSGAVGTGYYDNPNVAEMRIKQCSPSLAVQRHQQMIVALSQAAYDYGIGLSFSPNPHIHMSASKNGVLLTDREAIDTSIIHDATLDIASPKKEVLSNQEFRERVVVGQLLIDYEAKPLIAAPPFQDQGMLGSTTGLSRGNFLRLLSNRTEARTSYNARSQPDISILAALQLAGATYGLLKSEDAKKRASAIGLESCVVPQITVKKSEPVSLKAMEMLKDILEMSGFKEEPENCYHLIASNDQAFLIHNYFSEIRQMMGNEEATTQEIMDELRKIKINCNVSDNSQKPSYDIVYVGKNQDIQALINNMECKQLVPDLVSSASKAHASQIEPLLKPHPNSEYPDVSWNEIRQRLAERVKNSEPLREVMKRWAPESLYPKLLASLDQILPVEIPPLQVSDANYLARVSERHSPDVSKRQP